MPATRDVDLRRQHAALYTATAAPKLLEVPPLQYLSLEGTLEAGALPGESAAFQEGIEALYGVAYPLKFTYSKREGIKYPVMPLQGQWWSEEGHAFPPREGDPSWRWRLLILVPDFVSEDDVREQQAAALAKKGLAATSLLRLETIEEGLCAQVLHVGPYSAEVPTIEALHDFIAREGCSPNGPHHEIYLGDPRRAAPERLRTILRQPVARA
jgi:hypothetical protein